MADQDENTTLPSSNTPRTHRRPYKKSTNGCTSCKARKIKCDEVKPLCSPCQRKYVNLACCSYPTVGIRGASSKVPRKPLRSPESDLGSIHQPISNQPASISDRDRILELRLLHHYTKTTCKSQTLGSMLPLLRHPMWEIDIPQMAFSNEIVLNALLGISAIHLYASTPEDHSLVRASNSYFDKAISKYREAVVNVTPSNAEPVLVAACIIAHFTWLSAHSKDHKIEPYKIDLATFQMCKGIQSLISHTKPWLDALRWPHMFNTGSVPEIYSHRFIKSALQDIETLSACFANDDVSDEDSSVYAKVADDLILTYYNVAQKTMETIAVEQRLVTFLHRLPIRFAHLLEQEDPVAAALLARNMAMFVFLEDSNAWWIHGSGPNRVPYKAVWGIHSLLPVEFLWAADWPIKVISKEITLGPDEE